MFGRKKPSRSAANNPYDDLRNRALGATVDLVEIAPPADQDTPFAVIMDTGQEDAVVTLVCLADGSTSLYFSNGGGIIGAGAHPEVNVAARAFVAFSADFLNLMTPATDAPLPQLDEVQFVVKTQNSTLTARGQRMNLGENRHPLSPLFHSAHRVIGAALEANDQHG